MKWYAGLITSLFILSGSLTGIAQSKTFLDQVNFLQHCEFIDQKGELKQQRENGDNYYECKKKLDGFETYVGQKGDKGKLLIVALPNKNGEPIEEITPLLVLYTKISNMLGGIKQDSDVDAPLKARLGSMPNLKRIVVFMDGDKSSSKTFYIYNDGKYEIHFWNIPA